MHSGYVLSRKQQTNERRLVDPHPDWIHTNAADPPRDGSSTLTCGQRPSRSQCDREIAAGLAFQPAVAKIVVERLPGLLSQFEPDGSPSFPLANVYPIDCIAVGRYIVATEGNEAATAQLAVALELDRGKFVRSRNCKTIRSR
jgi:hypothetical protein